MNDEPSTQLSNLTADRVMACTLVLSLGAALVVGWQFGQIPLALLVGGMLAAAGLAMWRYRPGSLASRLTLAATLMSMVMLHIQLAYGSLELHFGVFVVLGLLLVYLDWRPIVLAAGLIAVHHVVFDRLQAMGLGTFCMPSASFLRTLVHAGYVVVQSTAEVFMAVWMSRISLQAQAASTALADTLHQLGHALSTTRESLVGIEEVSSNIASGNADLSQRTEQTASQLQRAASAMDELTSTVRGSAESAQTANRLVSSTASAAEQGGQVVREVVAKMEDITQSSRKIADIIGVIDGIAFQTNILALNAAVEAARAGEQGRGFAVVAGEVRSLAQRCAEAAKEIKSLIGASVENIEAGSRHVEDAGSTMQRVVDGVREVATLIEEISRAASEQSLGIASVSASVTEIDQMTQQNAAMVKQSATASQSLRTQAERLAGVVSTFDLDAIEAMHA